MSAKPYIPFTNLGSLDNDYFAEADLQEGHIYYNVDDCGLYSKLNGSVVPVFTNADDVADAIAADTTATAAIATSLGVTAGVKRYVALMTQSSTDAPVATVIENTLGSTPTPGYEDAGTYSSGIAYTAGKTFFALFPTSASMSVLQRAYTIDGLVKINTSNVSVSGAALDEVLTDGLLSAFLVVVTYP